MNDCLLKKKSECLAQMQILFQHQKQGLDIAPAAKFRLEGQLQLLLECGSFNWQDYIHICEGIMRDCDLPLPTKSYWLWCYNAGDITVRLPLAQKEAPVYQ